MKRIMTANKTTAEVNGIIDRYGSEEAIEVVVEGIVYERDVYEFDINLTVYAEGDIVLDETVGYGERKTVKAIFNNAEKNVNLVAQELRLKGVKKVVPTEVDPN